MKRKHSKWIAILTIATLLLGQTVTVWADEVTDVPEVIEASDIGIEDAVTEESATDSSEVESAVETETGVEAETTLADVPMLLAEEALVSVAGSWSSTEPGKFEFSNSNIVDVKILLEPFLNGESMGHFIWNTYEAGNGGSQQLEGVMKETGDYSIKVYVFASDVDNTEAQENRADCQYVTTSGVYSYTLPEELPEPSNIVFSTEGVLTWDELDCEYVKDYCAELYEVEDGNKSAWVTSDFVLAGAEMKIDFSSYIEEGKEYGILMSITSSNIEEYRSIYVGDGLIMMEGSSAGDSSEDTEDVLPPTSANWSNTTPGSFFYNNPNGKPVLFAFELIFEGAKPTHPFGFLVDEDCAGGGWDFGTSGEIKESGDYTVVVKAFPADMSIEEMFEAYADWEIYTTSPVYSYTYPGVDLPAVTNVQYNSTGIVTWDAVDSEYVDYYTFQLWDVTGGHQYYTASRAIKAGEECAFDCLEYITEGKEYAVTIDVRSSNIEVIHHNIGKLIPLVINDEGISDEVNNTLTDVTGGLSDSSTADEVTSAVTDVKSAFADTQEKRELQLAMQTNSDTRAEIEKLEGLYEDAVGVTTVTTVAEDTGIDAGKVSILGASLNATQAGEVAFDMTLTTDERLEEILGDDSYAKEICFSLDLTGAGVTPGNLAIPVTITMPVPNGINPNWLRATHYSLDGSAESIAVRNNGDGTISFTVTHFSEFLFYEAEAATTPSTSTSASSSANAEKLWTPTTEDEKARYSVFGREKLNYIVGTEGGYKAELINAMQGSLFFDTVNAAKGEYTVARTYNVEIDGKLVYEMAMPAMFILDIPEAYLATGRDYKMVCVSKNGEVVILDDLDTAAETITFLTNKFYAFALIYKDVVVTE